MMLMMAKMAQVSFAAGAVVAPPEFLAMATATDNSDIAALSCSKPTGTAEDDLMIAICGASANGNTITAPAGWTNLAAQTAATPSVAIFAKKAGNSEGSSYSFSYSNRFHLKRITMLSYRGGLGAVDAYGSWSAPATGVSTTAASIDALAAGALLAVYCTHSTTLPSAAPPGMTVRAQNGGAGGYFGIFAYDLTPSPAGPTGGKDLTWASSTGAKTGLLVQIR